MKKIGNIGFVCNVIGHIFWNFYEDDVIIVTSLVCRTQLVSAVFSYSFTTCQILKHYFKLRVTEKSTCSANETCLNDKHQCFIFQHIVQIHLNTYTTYKQVSDCLLLSKSLMNGWLHFHIWCQFQPTQYNFLHQTCIAGLVKHVTNYWMHLRGMTFGHGPFSHEKINSRKPFRKLRECFQR